MERFEPRASTSIFENWVPAVLSELTEISSVIGDVYDAATEPSLWQHALANLCSYVGGYSATLFWHDAATRNAKAFYLFNDDSEYNRLYFEKCMPMDPVFPASSFIEEGVVYGAADIVPQIELEQTRFYREWIAPQGITDAIAVNLEKGVMRSSFIVVRTDAACGMAGEEIRDRLAALVPHLQRAVAIGRLVDQEKAKQESLSEAIDHVDAAVFLVAPDGAVSFTNDPGKKMLDEAKLMWESGGLLHAASPKADRILYDIFTAAAHGDASVGAGVAVPLAEPSRERWFAHVLPLASGRRQNQLGHNKAPVAALFVRKARPGAPPPLELIANRYELLPSEVRVLDAIAKVQGVKQLAEFLGISQATVKTHLNKLFRKTGTKRQSELVTLMAGL
jgi:DNA-binding CsgD family transcriptional regulator